MKLSEANTKKEVPKETLKEVKKIEVKPKEE